jgi:hypothetical protein
MRLKILSDDEIEALYGRPRFTQEERVEYFTLSAQEKVALAQLHSLKSKVFFILQLGYFKARRMFFVFGLKDAVDDAAYVRDKYFSAFSEGDTEIAETTRLKQQRLILDLCKYRNADAVVRRKLEVRAGQAAAVCGKCLCLPRTHALPGRAAHRRSWIQQHAGYDRPRARAGAASS